MNKAKQTLMKPVIFLIRHIVEPVKHPVKTVKAYIRRFKENDLAGRVKQIGLTVLAVAGIIVFGYLMLGVLTVVFAFAFAASYPITMYYDPSTDTYIYR